MPVIDGIKMACVPCIRGHRSTKCNHASERVMVPVRKPGRPLSICPHPSSKPCSCGVTAAIPKKPTCPCSSNGPDRAIDPTDPLEESTTMKLAASHNQESCAASVASTASAKTSTPSSSRIQKTQPLKSSRKYSFDPSLLARVDVSQANIIPAALALDTSRAPPMPHLPPQVTALNGYDTKYMPDALMQASASQPQPQPMQMPMMVPMYAPMADAIMAAHMVGQISTPLSSPSPAPGFITGLAQQRIKSEPDISAHFRHQRSESVAEPAPAKKSCCGGGVKTTNGTPNTSEAEPNNDMIINKSQTNAPEQAQMQTAISMNTFYTPFSYPPQIGSFTQPLNPEQWKSFMDSYVATQTMQPAQTHAPIMAGANGYTNGLAQQHQTRQPPPDTAPCTCGDSCQCLGCWWHPYNQTTTDQVMEAYNAMWGDMLFDDAALSPLGRQSISGPSAPVKSPPATKGSCCGGGAVAQSPSPSPSVAAGKQAEGTPWAGVQGHGAESPSVAVTPSDGSGALEDQTLSADTFLFVHYPIHGGCLGESVTCPCGDDCECLGCAVHGNTGEDVTV